MTEKPLKEIPPELLSGYSMNGQILVELKYRDDSNSLIQSMINKQYNLDNFQILTDRIKRRDQNYYGMTDTWLYQCLFDFPVEGKDVLVIGSTAPWYEAVCVEFGAKSVTVLEYGNRPKFHELIDYKKETTDKFDVVLTISSLEHDGLGRYGDPLDPDADLKWMKKCKNVYMKSDGILILAIPIGVDRTYFNVHRVYGEKRFPLILEDLKIEGMYGFEENSLKNFYNNSDSTPYQPIVVLRKE